MAVSVLLVWLALLFEFNEGGSQNVHFQDTKGKAFTFAFLPDFDDTSLQTSLSNFLYFASSSDGICTVSYNDNIRRTTQVNLVANKVTEKALPDSTELNHVGSFIESKAIYVNCSTEIALYGYNKYPVTGGGSDSFTVLPNSIISTRYLVASFKTTAYIGIVATKANTLLTINLKSTCVVNFDQVTYRSGDVIKLTLGFEDVIRLGGSTIHDDRCDFSGTEIESSDPVSVFSGALYFYYSGTSHTFMVHQVPPLSAFSHEIIVPASSQSQSSKAVIRVIPSQNNTQLNVTSEFNGGYQSTSSHFLSAAGTLTKDYSPGIDVIIQSNKPVMVTQSVLSLIDGDSSLFIPGINQYGNDFLVRSFSVDQRNFSPAVTFVTDTKSIGDLRMNGVYPHGLRWSNLTTLPYSISSIDIQPGTTYAITSSSSVFVRVHEEASRESYRYNAGYRLENEKAVIGDAISLKCMSSGWVITLDMKKADLQHSDVPYIYLTESDCIGTLEGDILLFNESFHDCQTKSSVSNGTLSYTNTLIYTVPTQGILVRDVVWLHDVKCLMAVDGTDTVHIYPDYNTTKHSGTTGVIQGSAVHISLYTDATFHHAVPGDAIKARIGQPVYVQVESPGNQNTIMVVNSCDAHLEDEKHVSYLLIENGCAVDKRTQLLIQRNQVTRFKFEMFDLKEERDGIYVTCHVTFCDSMDFSDRCQQRCHTDPHIVG